MAQKKNGIKKLKEKNVAQKAQSPYPAQLKVFMDSGTKTFTTLMKAAPILKYMGINVEEDNRERLQQVMMQNSWIMVTGWRGRQREPCITEADLGALMDYLCNGKATTVK